MPVGDVVELAGSVVLAFGTIAEGILLDVDIDMEADAAGITAEAIPPDPDAVEAALALDIIDDASAGEIVWVIVAAMGCEPFAPLAPFTS
jgi:hypothetical protein